ncbi:hypothetical protein CIB84_011911 [Bambusicola thoracicus]|uniref:Calcium-activated potassium channel subunit beta n=1 Tax=Bambusicola thoracicus TaxID=9083 RepID=A0A2P4SJP7_BAMTH|nr:hypothetical protein CIB84_011911 [Bambusicola thoracicus]
MLAKKLVTAQKRGETRALCLGLGMVACSMMMYFFIGITIVPFYTKRAHKNGRQKSKNRVSHEVRHSQCSYVPGNSENSKEVKAKIEEIANNFKKYQTFPCYYDPGGMQTNVILSRLYPPRGLLFTFLWPTLMFTGGCLIIVLVKISQYVSVLSARQ